MTKAIWLALAAVGGSVLGVLGFLVIDSYFHLPFAGDELGAWTKYGFLSFGSGGAVCGLVMGRVACVWNYKTRITVPVTNETPSPNGAVKSRRKIRPLTWLYRA